MDRLSIWSTKHKGNFSYIHTLDQYAWFHSTVFLALPCDDFHSGDLGALSKVNHPGRTIHIEVVEDGAAVHSDGDITIHCPRRVTSDPLTAHVAFVLTFVVDPRTLLERKVLH